MTKEPTIQLSTSWAERLEAAAVDAQQPEKVSQAIGRISETDMPTSAMEEWRYSRIDDLDLSLFTPYDGSLGCGRTESKLLQIINSANANFALIETFNGLTGTARDFPAGLELENRDPLLVGDNFSSSDVFSDLNAALSMPVGLNIDSSFNSAIPIVVVRYLDGPGTAIFPSLCVNLGKNAKAKVIEVVVSPPKCAMLVVPMTKIHQDEGSSLEFLFIQDLGSEAQMVAHQVSKIGRDACFDSMSIVAGGGYSRIFTTSTISEPGALSKLNAAYFGAENQVLDFRTLQEHSARNGRSDLYFKGAAANSAHLVYSGMIKVDKGATSTDAYQTNKNLVLSEGARADSVPNLDIQENDVKCSHASSVGPIDQEQRYYLESRGIRPELVQQLIVEGFFAEMGEKSNIAGVREVLVQLAQRKWKEMN